MRSTLALSALFCLGALVLDACSCGDDDRCDADADCDDGKRCAPFEDPSAGRGRCLAGVACVADAECVAQDPRKRCDIPGQTFQCVFREGFADECDASRPCAFGQFCSSLLGRCLDASAAKDCARTSQCPTGQICDRAANRCIEDPGCYGADFCEVDEVCDLVSHECRSGAAQCASCLLTGTCADGATCVEASKECVAEGATAACLDGERCDPVGRCVQCTNADECGPGLFCNVAIGRCESNVQCASNPSECPDSPEVQCITCTAPEVCDARTRRCQAPATRCTSDVDCPGDRFCDTAQTPAICVERYPDCLDDLLDEPTNDTFLTARALDPAAGPSYDELKLCPGNVDWYRLDVAAGTYLTVDARFRHAQGDLDLQVFLPDGSTLIGESRSTNDNERIALEVGTDRTLLLRVFFAVPTINAAPYRLIVQREAGEVCADDANEPDDLPSEATPLASDAPVEGRLCSADPDWYVLPSVPAGTRVQVALTFRDNLGDLDLELYRAGQLTPLLASRSTGDGEALTHDATYGGDYFLRVVGKAADTNVYTLRAELRPSDGAVCLDDRFEPNDVPSASTSTTTGAELTNLTLCNGDEDWFAIELAAGEAVTAEASFLPGQDLELRLYERVEGLDPRRTPLRASVGTSPREFLGLRSPTGGAYLLRVHGHDGAQSSPYALRIDKRPLPACAPDAFDAPGIGEDLATAAPLAAPPTRLDDLSACPDDDDWFRLDRREGFSHIVRLHYLGTEGTLDVSAADASGSSLGATTGDARDVKELILPSSSEPAFLHVFGDGGAVDRYALVVDLVPGFVCVPDALEPNDDIARASPVRSSTVAELRGLTLCATRAPSRSPGDEDWFQLTPPAAGARIEAVLDHTQGDLFLELIGPGGVRRACVNAGPERCYSDTFELSEAVAFTSTVAGPYFLRVGSIYASPNVFDPPPDSDTPYVLRVRYSGP